MDKPCFQLKVTTNTPFATFNSKPHTSETLINNEHQLQEPDVYFTNILQSPEQDLILQQ